MGRLNGKVQSTIAIWERKLLDWFRQLRRKNEGDFFVLIHFSDDLVTLHMIIDEQDAVRIHKSKRKQSA